MRIFRGLDEYDQSLGPTAVAVGAFDGVHIGHQALLKRLLEESETFGIPAVVVTFTPHPQVALGDGTFRALSTDEERIALLEEQGIPDLLVLQFDAALANMSARQFVQDVLVERLRMRVAVVGSSHSFGARREGDVDYLWQLGASFGFSVVVVEPLKIEGERVCSSRIRELISAGQVDVAARMLGRYYSVAGQVIPGDGRGESLGFPTANVRYEETKLLPGNGVYATKTLTPDGELLDSVTNVGVVPTFKEGQVLVETHILNFNQPLYGQRLEVRFVRKIRDERKFYLKETLQRQIAADVRKAKELLAAEEGQGE